MRRWGLLGTGVLTMKLTLFAGVLLLCAAFPGTAYTASFPSGASKTECQSRVFWIWVDKDFLGDNPWRLEALDETGFPVAIDDDVSSQCGYSINQDLYNNVEIRISFLGCWVHNVADQLFDIAVQFQVSSPNGAPVLYPVSMSCRLDYPWSVREVICETNYMEVSVRRIIPWVSEEYLYGDLQHGWPVSQGPISQWEVQFRLEDRTLVLLTAAEASSRGYGLNVTATRVVFRAPYNTSESQIMMVADYHIEVIQAKMSFSQPLVILLVDTTTACPTDPPIFTESSLSWVTPAVLSPLVLDPVAFRDRGVSMGLNGKLIDANIISRNGYTFSRNTTSVDVTVPIGAPGGYTESDIVDNSYGTTYSIHLLLERHWRGAAADTTRHAAFKPITTPFRPQSPVFINNTDPAKGYFDVTLGNFFPDVDLKSFIINKVVVTMAEATRRRFKVVKVPNANGTNAFILQVPFVDRLVEQKYLYGLRRQYTLYVTYVLTLLEKRKDFTYTDVVECIVEDVVPPTFNGSCASDRLILDMIQGNMDEYWVPFVRDLPLTNELAQSQRYIVYKRRPAFHLEVPIFAIGLVYEDITLRGIRARLDFTLKDNKTLDVKSGFSVSCNFPTDRLLICLPNGTMKVTVLSLDTKPRFDPRKTHLKDPTCTPQEADDARALFSFSVFTCGTTRQFDGNFLVYENEVGFDREVLPLVQPIISRDSTYRLTVRCRYPIRDTQRVWGKYNKTVAIRRGFSAAYSSGQARVLRKRARNTHDAELRVAKDATFTAFYVPGDFPVSVTSVQSLFFQADVSDSPRAVLSQCWATSTPQMDGSPQWDFILDGCAKTHTTIAQMAQDEPPRFQVKIEGHLSGQLYVHCVVSICDPMSEPESCSRTCDQPKREMERREAPPAQPAVISVGPIQIVAEDGGVGLQHMAEKKWSAWTVVVSFGLAVVAVFTLASIALAVRLLVR
ncbi:hypothetical protein FKM82_018697 [Ascaphus truei]